jgi:DNA-directed RNA polymerase subunit RPC12/RpoP
METHTTFSKCKCQHCSQGIQFEVSQAGQTVTCPNCGMETVLFIPRVKRATNIVRKPARFNLWLFVALSVAVAVLVFGAVYMVFLPKNTQIAESVGMTGMGIFMLFAGFVVFIWAMLWILFPVFVYFSLNRLEAVLKQIEVNTRKH